MKRGDRGLTGMSCVPSPAHTVTSRRAVALSYWGNRDITLVDIIVASDKSDIILGIVDKLLQAAVSKSNQEKMRPCTRMARSEFKLCRRLFLLP